MIEITPRKVRFNFEEITRFWHDQSPVATYHVNVFGLFIPEGEKFFIQSVKAFLNCIHDPKLKKDVRAFLIQEANHHREHLKYSVHTIFKFYPNLKSKPYQFRITKLIAWIGGAKFRLSMTAAGEHFTAILADFYLNHPQHFCNMPASVQALWQWHFLEEIEHKGVAFDVLKAVGGGYVTRITGYIFMSLFFMVGYTRPFIHMAKVDGNLFSLSFYKQIYTFYFRSPGILTKLMKPYFSYFLPAFHPWKYNNIHLIKSLELK